jgi:hypothetical protein
LAVGVFATLAGLLIFAFLPIVAFRHEIKPEPVSQSSSASGKAVLPALTPDEERYAVALWEIHRDVTTSAVAMSFAGIAFKTEASDARTFEQRIERLATVFEESEERARHVVVPTTMAEVHARYANALSRYSVAAQEMLKFTQDGEPRHLSNAHEISISASEDMLRVGDVLWPGHYKPH